ncbi:hypothetical protein SNE32_16800, partial [Lysobacter sp. D1-1-M9]|uniref:hypothetical protein n=1 Tax=Novilysobacter longmucuonensis TaxID=3098603 RepID=UPI002FC9FACA
VTKAVSLIAQTIDGLSEPHRRLLEFLGILESGPTALGEFAGGMDAVSDEFAKRMVENTAQFADAVTTFGDGVTDGADRVVSGLDRATDSSERLAGASGALADGAATAQAALEGQAQGAMESAASTTSAAVRMEVDAERLKKAFAD